MLEHVENHVGVKRHTGELLVWCHRGREALPDLEQVSKDVWTANRAEDDNGLVILGTPLGTPDFVRKSGFSERKVYSKSSLS